MTTGYISGKWANVRTPSSSSSSSSSVLARNTLNSPSSSARRLYHESTRPGMYHITNRHLPGHMSARLCVRHIKPFFLPDDIEHTQCPCSFSMLERYVHALWSQNCDTEILPFNAVRRVDNVMPCHCRTGYDKHKHTHANNPDTLTEKRKTKEEKEEKKKERKTQDRLMPFVRSDIASIAVQRSIITNWNPLLCGTALKLI